MIKAVIFDLDGTLLDRNRSLQAFVEAQYDRYKSELSNISKEKYVERFIQLDNNGYTWKDKVYTQLIEEFEHVSFTMEHLLQDYMERFRDHAMPYPNTIEILEWLKYNHIKIGMITNGKDPFQLKNIESLGIQHYFETILVSETEGISKPDREIFYRALTRLNVNANEAMFVGDHPINDVQASSKVGMISVGKKNGECRENTAAHEIIEDLLEIRDIIQRYKH